LSGFATRDGPQVQGRTATGAFECCSDLRDELSGLGADLPGSDSEDVDLVHGHAPTAGERIRVVLGRQMPFGRVHLHRQAKLRPPPVGHGDELLAGEDLRVEQRHRQAGPGQQVLQVPLRGRPDPVSHVGQRLAKQRRPDIWSGHEFRGQIQHLAATPLHGISDDRPHVAQVIQAADGIGDGPGQQGIAHRSDLLAPPRHPGGPVQADEGRITASPRRRHQDIDELGDRTPDVVMTGGRQARDHTATACVKQRRHLLLETGRRPGCRHVNAG
jgi:hypothetical protein